METVLTVSLAALGLLVGLVLLLTVIGRFLPPAHVATRSLRLKRGPAEVWAIVTDLGGQLTWRPDLKGISKVSEPAREQGLEGAVWREQFGRHAFDLATREARPPDAAAGTPGRMVRELISTGLPFHGRWEYLVTPQGDGGTIVRLTEYGTVTNSFFRAIGRIVGNARHLERYLSDLARLLGEPARLE